MTVPVSQPFLPRLGVSSPVPSLLLCDLPVFAPNDFYVKLSLRIYPLTQSCGCCLVLKEPSISSIKSISRLKSRWLLSPLSLYLSQKTSRYHLQIFAKHNDGTNILKGPLFPRRALATLGIGMHMSVHKQ